MARIFTTTFPLKAERTLDELIETAKGWFIETTKTPFANEEFAALREHGDKIERKGYSIEIARYKSDAFESVGAQARMPGQRQSVWTTEIVGSKADGAVWVSVVMEQDKPAAESGIVRAYEPDLVKKKLLKELGGGRDAFFEVSGNPHRIDGSSFSDFLSATAIIKGEAHNGMPIVYVSATNRGEYEVDSARLAAALAGLAHVVVEPSREFSFRLREQASKRNVYQGAAGIYWPHSTYFQRLLPPGSATQAPSSSPCQSKEQFERTIYETVLDSLANQRLRPELDWKRLDSFAKSDLLERLRSQSDKATGDLAMMDTLYQEDRDNLMRQIDDANRRIGYLEDQLVIANTQPRQEEGARFLNAPCVAPLYKGELEDTVITIVESQIPTLGFTRRQQVAKGFVAANKTSKEREERLAEIKRIFTGYREMDGHVKQGLKRIGFVAEDDGKHYKIHPLGDESHTVTISRTSSDVRVGENIYKEIKKTFF